MDPSYMRHQPTLLDSAMREVKNKSAHCCTALVRRPMTS